MVRNPAERKAAEEWILAEEAKIAEMRSRLLGVGLPEEGISAALEPMVHHVDARKDDIARYAAAKELKQLPPVYDLEDIGKFLISVRTALGMTQGEFAAMAGLHINMLSRYERVEYLTIDLEHVAKVLRGCPVRFSFTATLKEEAAVIEEVIIVQVPAQEVAPIDLDATTDIPEPTSKRRPQSPQEATP